MSLDSGLIERARAVPIEDEIARRGFKLRRQGRELIGPCPVCGGKDRFGINLKKQVFNCRGCGARGGDAIALVRFIESCGFPEAVELLTGTSARCSGSSARKPITKHKGPDSHEIEQHRKAAWLWSQSKPTIGSVAEQYLRQARGVTCALPPTLGFLPATNKYPPALIAPFGLCVELEPGVPRIPGSVDAVHITRLRSDGSDRERGNAAKIMLGSPGPQPIVIAPPNDLLGLAITEGIETGLSVYGSTGLGVWVAGAANRMPALAEQIPGYIECVTIYQEADRAGELQASKLAQSLVQRGMEVRIAGASA